MDYIAHIIEFVPGWSLEGTSEVSEDFAAEFDESWPAVIFQNLIDAYPDFGVCPLTPKQAEEMAWPSHAEDQNARRSTTSGGPSTCPRTNDQLPCCGGRFNVWNAGFHRV